MLYLTYNDLPTGVYNSQVIDVCKFIRKELNTPIRLVAIISIRNFFNNRKKIKNELPDAFVIPMFPKHKNWKLNQFSLILLLLFIKEKSIIARGPFATSLALSLRNKRLINSVCFDGRGAYTAEFNEYSVVPDKELQQEIFTIEKESILNSDYRISVSEKLIYYWKEQFNYVGTKHSQIPCTFDSTQLLSLMSAGEIQKIRFKMDVSEDEILMVYSGSSAGWQSLQGLDNFLKKQMSSNPKIKVIFLAQIELKKLKVYEYFPTKVQQKWVSPKEVNEILSVCDYGILLRENTETNRVASPTKFAEYLLAGLPVIISKNLGDFSEFVVNNNCGFIVENQALEGLTRVSYSEKTKCFNLATSSFSKTNFKAEYTKVMKSLEGN